MLVFTALKNEGQIMCNGLTEQLLYRSSQYTSVHTHKNTQKCTFFFSKELTNRYQVLENFNRKPYSPVGEENMELYG